MTVSVVVPVYNSEASLAELKARVTEVLDAHGTAWELILVDDGSQDASFQKMKALRQADSRVQVVRLGRNCGQHHAIFCGLRLAQNDCVITLDDDLQNPPEEIPRFLQKLAEGYDVVIGRITTKEHEPWRNLGSRIVQMLTNRILGKPKSLYLSSFRAFSRGACRAMLQYRGVHVYIPAVMLRSIPVEKMTNVEVTHHPRKHGKSNYSPGKLLKLTSYLLINHSRLPLGLVTGWGFFLSLASILFAIAVLIRSLINPIPVPGWTSLIVILLFVSGNILLALGILGEYLGRLVDEVSRDQESAIFSVNEEER